MKIIITNIVVLNGGDGAILFGMLKALKTAFGEKCDFVVFATEPKAAARMYPEICFRETLGLAATRAPQSRYIGRLVRTLRSGLYQAAAWCYFNGLKFLTRLLLPDVAAQDIEIYAAADLVVSSGGTYLKEEYGIVSQICDYRLTLLLQRPLAFFTQTLGPFSRSESKAAIRFAFNQACCVLVRDERSRQNLLEAGVTNEDVYRCADAAFALADPTVIELAKYRTLPTDRPLRIAISVRHWHHFKMVSSEKGMERYLEIMTGITEWLVNTLSAEVTFLSTCQGNSEYDDDSDIACLLVGRLSGKAAAQVKVVREFVRFDDLLKLLPKFDLVLATRMHMAILALISGTPAIPFALEFKTNELFSNLGLGDWVIEVDGCSIETATDRIGRFLEAIPELRAEMFRKVESERSSAMEAGMHLKNSLELSKDFAR